MLKLLRQTPSRFKSIPILEESIQQGIAHEKISRTPRNQKELNSLNCKWDLGIIIKSIKLFSQNVHKNRVLTDMILETNRDFNIIFIQEPS